MTAQVQPPAWFADLVVLPGVHAFAIDGWAYQDCGHMVMVNGVGVQSGMWTRVEPAKPHVAPTVAEMDKATAQAWARKAEKERDEIRAAFSDAIEAIDEAAHNLKRLVHSLQKTIGRTP